MTIHYTKGEEWANTLSHGVGILIGIAGGGYLLLTAMKSGNPWATGGMWLYLFGCYIAMGCSIFVGFKPLCQHVPPAFIYWLIGEGVSYITGAVFYSFPKLPYMHSVLHLLVL